MGKNDKFWRVWGGILYIKKLTDKYEIREELKGIYDINPKKNTSGSLFCVSVTFFYCKLCISTGPIWKIASNFVGIPSNFAQNILEPEIKSNSSSKEKIV